MVQRIYHQSQTCSTCEYAFPDASSNLRCLRFPIPTPTKPTGWCGEYTLAVTNKTQEALPLKTRIISNDKGKNK